MPPRLKKSAHSHRSARTALRLGLVVGAGLSGVAIAWVLIANRYFVQIELQNQDPKELQDWIKRVDLKKLAAIK